ncbi:MAG: hypothetical protein U0822_20740 [Anaerolineae bacterium]
MKKNKKNQRFEYAIVVQEPDEQWTLWPQKQEGPAPAREAEPEDEADTQTPAEVLPFQRFDDDLEMLSYMSRGGWDLVTGLTFHDGWPRLLFKRRLRD